MVKINQIGVGRKSSGTIDGITYYSVNGKTFARSLPQMPASVFNTPKAKKRQAIFKFVQQHMKLHLNTIKQTFASDNKEKANNRYYSSNGKALTQALGPVADRYLAGEIITINDVEAAISSYAMAHPYQIKLASRSGYNDVYLTGPWPNSITLKKRTGDNTMIILVAENGTQTTISPDGSVTANPVSGDDSGSNDGGGGNNNGGSEED